MKSTCGRVYFERSEDWGGFWGLARIWKNVYIVGVYLRYSRYTDINIKVKHELSQTCIVRIHDQWWVTAY